MRTSLLLTRAGSLVVVAAILVAAALVAGCSKAPVTGRKQLILISPQQEARMGVVAFAEILKKERISTDPRYTAAVGRVVERLSRVTGGRGYRWEYKVIDNDEEINAFALPGGKIGVYTGILRVAATDAGLATVLGHEVAHVTARHGAERVTTGLLAQLGAVGLNLALRNRDPRLLNIVNQAYGLGITVGAILPFSRTQEAEADHIGLIYMARAGYNPREAIAFWERMHEATRNLPRPPEFLSTHPDYNTRRANLLAWQAEAMRYYLRAPKAPNLPIAAPRASPAPTAPPPGAHAATQPQRHAWN